MTGGSKPIAFTTPCTLTRSRTHLVSSTCRITPRASAASTTIAPPSKPKTKTRSGSSLIQTVPSPSELNRLLKAQKDANGITVIKCFASYCAGCRGVEPKYKKIAAAYTRPSSTISESDVDATRVTFCQMDYAANEQFCRDCLGVQNLPFFAVFRGQTLLNGEAIGWRSIGQRLIANIESARAVS